MGEVDIKRVSNATKWSAATEIATKLITPITSMVLARLLTPDAFGVITTIMMIITFAEIFTDAGFQKYLIQHEFNDGGEREESTTVAFWSNFAMSMVIWGMIALFSEPLATIVGNPGLGDVIAIACVSIPLAAFSSIQMALYKRDFDFKTLFKVRLAGILTPILVTIPLAVIMRSYWALVIGTIATNLVNAITLTLYSKWKPRLFFSFARLKEMLSFSIWSMIEAITIWMTSYIDIFIIGVFLNEYYLGIYKTSITTVGQITSLITAATTPILFSALSRLQDDRAAFKEMFLKFQKLVGLLIIPMGIGIFCYRNFITVVLLGGQWGEAANFIGLWGLSSAFMIVLSHFSSEVYRALGRPKLSALSQILHIIVLCPAMLIAVKYGWEVIYTTRAVVRIEAIAVNLVILYVVANISTWEMIANITPSILASCVMVLFAIVLQTAGDSYLWSIISIIICILIYFLSISLFKTERKIILNFISKYRTGI